MSEYHSIVDLLNNCKFIINYYQLMTDFRSEIYTYSKDQRYYEILTLIESFIHRWSYDLGNYFFNSLIRRNEIFNLRLSETNIYCATVDARLIRLLFLRRRDLPVQVNDELGN